MASYHIIAVFLIGCLSCCSGKVRVGQNDKLVFTNLTVVNVQSDLDKEFDGKGLEPWYDVAKSFIHSVQKDDLPYDDIEKIKDGDDFKVDEFLKGWELPFLVTFAIGFLFAIIVPIVGFVFCCCRCCGNCGGEMVQKQSDKDGLKRTVFGIVLAIITIIMFAGCLMAFVCNDRITDTVESYRTSPTKAIDTVDEYLNKTLKVVTDILIVDVLSVLDIVLRDVLGLPAEIGSDVKRRLEKTVREPLDRVVELGQSTMEMQLLLKNVTIKTEELQKRSEELNNNLTEVNNQLNTACFGSSCPGINLTSVTPGANFSALPNVTGQLTSIDGVINDDELLEKAGQGLGEFNDIDKRIKNDTKDTTADIVNEVKSARKKIANNRDDIVDKVNDVLKRTKGWKDDIDKLFDDTIEPYDKYRYYAGIGLTCLILLPVLLMAFGLLCGVFGHGKGATPSERGTVSNMGGNCLMAAVGFMFIFVFFLMLFTAICFLLGAHLEKGCSSVRDGTFLTEFVDNKAYWDGKYILADAFLNDKSINLTVTSVLECCTKNDPLFKAIKGEKRWNLTKKFSVRDKLGDFEGDLDNFDVPINNTEILNNATIQGLKNLRDSGVDKISFEAFFNETRKDIVKGVGDLRRNLTTLNNTTPNNNLTAIIVRLGEVETEASAMKTLSEELERDVQELKKIGGDVANLANETLVKSQDAATDFIENANKAVKDAVTKFSGKLLSYVDQMGEHSVDVIGNQLGSCRILTDVYDASINLLCRDTVFPFNGFWFSIGFCLFFYIPAIIFSVKLAKHYRRMRFEEGFDRHEGLEMAHVNDRNNKPWLNQGNSVYPK